MDHKHIFEIRYEIWEIINATALRSTNEFKLQKMGWDGDGDGDGVGDKGGDGDGDRDGDGDGNSDGMTMIMEGAGMKKPVQKG